MNTFLRPIFALAAHSYRACTFRHDGKGLAQSRAAIAFNTALMMTAEVARIALSFSSDAVLIHIAFMITVTTTLLIGFPKVLSKIVIVSFLPSLLLIFAAIAGLGSLSLPMALLMGAAYSRLSKKVEEDKPAADHRT
jgi:hypothetical protein